MRIDSNLLSGILFLAAFLPYWTGVFKGKIVPNRVSWMLWLAGDVLTFLAMRANGASNYLITCAIGGASITTTLAFFYGKSEWQWTDRTCLVLGAFGFALWQIIGNSFIGLFFGLAALLVAAIPTWTDTWHRPREAGLIPWLIFCASCVFGLLAVPDWNFWHVEHWGQPLTFTIIDYGVLFIIIGRWSFVAPTPTA